MAHPDIRIPIQPRIVGYEKMDETHDGNIRVTAITDCGCRFVHLLSPEALVRSVNMAINHVNSRKRDFLGI